jgi:two-component system NtrC family sensor kinase
MLRTKLFQAFALLVILFSGLSAYLGTRMISGRVIDEAQTRARLDLSSAWALHESKLQQIETIVRMAAAKELVQQTCESRKWDDPELLNRLERIRVSFNLDFLDVVSPDGQVMVRTRLPHSAGDFRISDPAIAAAMQGTVKSCVTLLSRNELEREAEGLGDRAFLELENTPRARLTEKKSENRGMAMVAASPVRSGDRITGLVYGGILVNRNSSLVDHIQDVVFRNEAYKGQLVGTATIFLDDSRIATTVRLANGNRAIGTRVSKEVADRVLDNGQPWIGDAFVVSQWYLTAYEPIRDGMGQIVGMLYVGILKQPFDDMSRAVVLRFILISVLTLFVGLVLAFVIAARLAAPIHRLVEASTSMSSGDRPAPIQVKAGCDEIERLIRAYNQMTATLADREDKLRALNRSYMETLGFVSHELKSPVATIMNYVYLLREQKLGPVTDKQGKAIHAIEMGSNRLVEMVRHYLNLSRIENGEVHPVRGRVIVLSDVVKPLLDTLHAEIEAKRMCLTNGIGAEVCLDADINMVREVFENLISNAIKYGREQGEIALSCRASGDFVEFAVRNSGDGIPEDRMGELFQKFSRLNSTESERKQKGTGLGLFITKNIVEAHGGRITAVSKPGEWVEFVFTMPAHKGGDIV